MGPTLRIIAVNDVYTLENLPRLATLLQRERTRAPADLTLVTLAGDFVAPSLLSGLDAGRGMVDCLNRLGVTHVSLGNHEDDIPTPELLARIGEFRGVWLSTNVRGLHPKLKREDVVQVGRVRVALIGLVMDDPAAYRRPPFGGAALEPPNACAQREAARLLGEGIDCVIPMTHQSIADDRALARAWREPPFPLLLGGHEHTPFLEEIEGTVLVKAGADAALAAVADLSWPEKKPRSGFDLPRVSVRLEPVADCAEDRGLRAIADGHLAKVHELERATLMTLAPGEELTSIGTRRTQTTFGARVCSMIRDVLGAEACLINGGGIRGNKTYRERVTFADVKAELPFENTLVVARIPGRVVREAVAASRARAPAESGGFLQVDGGVSIDAGNQVTAIAGAPLEEEREYRVALVRDLFGGMDHQEPLLAFARAFPQRVPPAEAGREVKQCLVEACARSLWKRLGGFDAVDKNHDGQVSEEELAESLAALTHEPASPLEAGLVMNALDQDRDHRLSREEAARLEGESKDG